MNQMPDAGDHASSGFTLVELLVSLVIFALISLAGVGLVETVIEVQQRTKARSERLAEIQRALYLVGADFEQLSRGPVDQDGAIAFTRSSAQGDYPVVYRFAEGALYRRAADLELPVLSGVERLNLRFFKDGAWTSQPMTEENPARPKAIELTMMLSRLPQTTGGPVRRVIELPDER